MEDALRVTLVANAGVLVEYRGAGLLIDAVFGTEAHPFSSPPERTVEKLLDGAHPFERVDYLLFTHAHPDHFSPELTAELLRRRTVKGAFLPDCPGLRTSGLTDVLRESGAEAVLLGDETEAAERSPEPWLTIRAFRTLHLDEKYRRVPHFCYLLTCGEKRLLFTADADYLSENFSDLNDCALRAAFVNPLFFNALVTGRYFHGTLNTETICVYHVPFEGEDSMNMRGSLRRMYERWGERYPPVLTLTEPFERLTL